VRIGDGPTAVIGDESRMKSLSDESDGKTRPVGWSVSQKTCLDRSGD